MDTREYTPMDFSHVRPPYVRTYMHRGECMNQGESGKYLRTSKTGRSIDRCSMCGPFFFLQHRSSQLFCCYRRCFSYRAIVAYVCGYVYTGVAAVSFKKGDIRTNIQSTALANVPI